MLTSLPTILTVSFLLALIQGLAALPWLLVLDPAAFKEYARKPVNLLRALLVVLGVGLAIGAMILVVKDRVVLSNWGRFYAAVLNLQLALGCLVFFFWALLGIWPKGGAVALSAFREGLRQPMYWFITVLALVFLILLPIFPYFTFGEDRKMVKELGFSLIMLSSALFGVLAASMSISEEIEGRTAVTLMSKPVSRRQFLIGKFTGILLASLVMTLILSWVFDWVLILQPVIGAEKDTLPDPTWFVPFTDKWLPRLAEATFFLRGALWWFDDSLATFPGIVLGFCQAMVLIAIAVALATRLPMIVNVVSCAVIFFLGHLTPLLAQVSQAKLALVQFMGQLFDTLLPGLDFFDLGPAIVRDTPPPTGPFSIYVGTVALYAIIYTAIALLFGLILFEDRDLA